jgi:hypothetical protein
MKNALLAVAALASFALPVSAQAEVNEVANGDSFNCGGTTVTYTIEQNSIMNTVTVTATTDGGSSASVTGTPGQNSSASNPTCSAAPSMSTTGANAITTRINAKTGRVQYKNSKGKWVTVPRPKAKKVKQELPPQPPTIRTL